MAKFSFMNDLKKHTETESRAKNKAFCCQLIALFLVEQALVLLKRAERVLNIALAYDETIRYAKIRVHDSYTNVDYALSAVSDILEDTNHIDVNDLLGE